MVHREPIIRATLTVVITVWIALTWRHILEIGHHLDVILFVGLSSICGLLCGATIVFMQLFSERVSLRNALAGERMRGLRSNLGLIPLHLMPKSERALPNLVELCKRVPEITQLSADAGASPATWIEIKLKQAQQTDPPVAALMHAVLRTLTTYDQQEKTPAGPRPGDHGGRSLLQHSLLVAFLVNRISESFEYKPEDGVVLADANFTWINHANNPIVVLTALAHDIGKVLVFKRVPGRENYRVDGDHSRAGLRLLALMPEYWNITLAQRDLIASVIFAYHEPSLMAMAHGSNKPLDDRRMALMQLLIRADKMAGATEARSSYVNTAKLSQLQTDDGRIEPQIGQSALDHQMLNAAIVAAHDPAAGRKLTTQALQEAGKNGTSSLLDSAIALLTDTARINSVDDAQNIAFKYDDPRWKRSLLVIHEMGFRVALLDARGGPRQLKDMPRQRGKVAEITSEIQKLLAGAGLLWDGYTEDKRTPGNQLVNIRWVSNVNYWSDRDNAIVKPNFKWAPDDNKNWKLEWPAAYVVDITDHAAFDEIRKVPSYDCVPVFGGNVLGSRGRLALRGPTSEAAPPTSVSIAISPQLQEHPTDGAASVKPTESATGNADTIGAPLAEKAIEATPVAPAISSGGLTPTQLTIHDALTEFVKSNRSAGRLTADAALEAVNLVDAVQARVLTIEQQNYVRGLPKTINAGWWLSVENEGRDIWLQLLPAAAEERADTLSAGNVAR